MTKSAKYFIFKILDPIHHVLSLHLALVDRIVVAVVDHTVVIPAVLQQLLLVAEHRVAFVALEVALHFLVPDQNDYILFSDWVEFKSNMHFTS